MTTLTCVVSKRRWQRQGVRDLGRNILRCAERRYVCRPLRHTGGRVQRSGGRYALVWALALSRSSPRSSFDLWSRRKCQTIALHSTPGVRSASLSGVTRPARVSADVRPLDLCHEAFIPLVRSSG